jgi:biopolymer transport protein ExbD
MSKIKVKRQNVFVDMTAMCDVAFLLLTFFILTSKFRPNEPVQVDLPPSRKEIILPAQDIMLITVDKKGRVFFGIDDQEARAELLSRVAQEYSLTLTESQMSKFKLIDQFGVPLNQLSQFLSLGAGEAAQYVQPGVMMKDTANNELSKLIRFARLGNSGLRIAIKADKDSDYDKVNKVIETLLDMNINRFNLVTTAKAGEAIN